MNTPFEFEHETVDRIVYVRSVAVSELPEDIRDHAEDADTFYAVHSSDGERLAFVKDRELAFFLARENDLAPVSVH